MNEIICPKCGKPNPPEAKFCEFCLTLFPGDEPAGSSSSDANAPDWLQKIREKNQTEKPDTPPLGEFGEAEERPFSEPITPGEIPDWLKELQNSETPKPPEPPEPASDWMTRLHEILPESARQSLQSTTFYTEEELAAMAAAARQLDATGLETPDQTSTQPLDVPSTPAPSDFKYSTPATSEEIPTPSQKSFKNSLAADLPEPAGTEFSSNLPPEEKPASESWISGNESVEKPAESSPWLPSSESPKAIEPPVLYGTENLAGEGSSMGPQPADETGLYMPPEPVASEPEKVNTPFASFLGQNESGEPENNEEDKPEKLIPEGILQPQYNRSVEYSGRLDLSDSQRTSIALLKSMLVGEIQPQTPSGTHSKISGRTLRMAIGILLLVVMIFPLVSGYVITGQQVLFSPGVVAMHKAIIALPENAPFLIITDYEPAFSSEMKAASTGVIDNLMIKGLNFSILSTVPSGPALAHDLISSVRSGVFAYQPEKIAYLGFLPGGTTGLQDFIRSPREAMPLLDTGRYAWTYPASQSVFSIQDYAGILVITENTETGRAWIEQLHGVMIDKPLLMVVSAQSAPLMRPYLDSDQLSGLIGGRIEGAMYDRIMEAPPRAVAVTASYQAGILLAVALIILGGLYGILQGLFNRHSPSSTEDLHAD